MNKFTNPLSNIKVASPCSQDWNEMIGTDRKRFCGECKLNVYNLSGMSRREAENLLMNSEGRLCVRFYRRADGSVLTKDCPVGWQAIKRRVSRAATAFASFAFAAFGGIGLTNYFAKASQPNTMGLIVSGVENPTAGEVVAEETKIAVEKPEKFPSVMGAFISREYRGNDATVGKIVTPKRPNLKKYGR